MTYKNAGFIGGGRIARILLNGWKRKSALPAEIKVVEINTEVAERLKQQFPEASVSTTVEDLKGSEIIFLAVHPPAMPDILPKLKGLIAENTVICSFVPKFSLSKLMEGLGGQSRIIRMNPLATSYVNAGYNPASFGPGISPEDKSKFLNQMAVLGQTPEVKDELIEVYASVSAMGPSYLWFLFYEMVNLGESFGLRHEQAVEAVSSMLIGAARVMVESGLSPDEVMDLIPAQPLAEEEEKIKEIFRQKILGVYNKLTS